MQSLLIHEPRIPCCPSQRLNPPNTCNAMTSLLPYSVINRPPIPLQKLRTSLLQRQIGSQLINSQGLPRQRVRGGPSQMFEDGAAFIGMPGFGDDGVVHDAEGDVVDEVVGDLLFLLLAQSSPLCSGRWGIYKHTLCVKFSGSANANTLLSSSTFLLALPSTSSLSSLASTQSPLPCHFTPRFLSSKSLIVVSPSSNSLSKSLLLLILSLSAACHLSLFACSTN